jgi:hypothetical protein
MIVESSSVLLYYQLDLAPRRSTYAQLRIWSAQALRIWSIR